ncbi:hypothetical protein PM082_005892 [Marasmius tenuissimus]|nr:hypothetical protein PM082_005892 [Marasmius tenuissimus]
MGADPSLADLVLDLSGKYARPSRSRWGGPRISFEASVGESGRHRNYINMALLVFRTASGDMMAHMGWCCVPESALPNWRIFGRLETWKQLHPQVTVLEHAYRVDTGFYTADLSNDLLLNFGH